MIGLSIERKISFLLAEKQESFMVNSSAFVLHTSSSCCGTIWSSFDCGLSVNVEICSCFRRSNLPALILHFLQSLVSSLCLSNKSDVGIVSDITTDWYLYNLWRLYQ